MTAAIEVACDESGYEGEKLVGGETDMFAHACVVMDAATAADCVREARARIGSPATEYKSGHFLRQRHRPALVWLLAPGGPIAGHAHVYLVDKTYFLVDRLVAALTGRPDPVAAARLLADGPDRFTPSAWDAFLLAANDLMRAKGSPDPPLLPALDPLFPALERVVARWGGGERRMRGGGWPVRIVHDQQKTFSEARVAEVARRLGAGLVELRLVDSAGDPRIQVADYLAGVARAIASAERAGRGDPELVALLRPYVDPESVLPPA